MPTRSASEGVDLDGFLEVSALLTGFTVGELRATGLVERYHTVCSAEVEQTHLAALVQTAVTVRDLAASDDQAVKEVASALTHLWYLGVWPRPRTPVGEAAGDEGAPFVVSPRAYAEGLAWKTFHVAPPGTAAPGFGSWAYPPRGGSS